MYAYTPQFSIIFIPESLIVLHVHVHYNSGLRWISGEKWSIDRSLASLEVYIDNTGVPARSYGNIYSFYSHVKNRQNTRIFCFINPILVNALSLFP